MTVRNSNCVGGRKCLIIRKLNAWRGCIATSRPQLISSLIQLPVCLTPQVLQSQTALAQLCTSSSPLTTPDYKIKSALNPVNTTLKPWNWYSAMAVHHQLYENWNNRGPGSFFVRLSLMCNEDQRSYFLFLLIDLLICYSWNVVAVSVLLSWMTLPYIWCGSKM